MPRFRLSYCRGVLYLVIGLAVVELLFLNFLILYTYAWVRQDISAVFSDSDPDVSLMDRLLKSPTFRNLVYEGKSGGFLSLLQETLERVYIVSNPQDSSAETSAFNGRKISFLGLDVSSSGESAYLHRRIVARGRAFTDKYRNIIIDIGANDGLMSSNSFNFIQWGWNAILVEPQLSLLQLAKRNLERYTDPYNEKRQRVILVNAMLGAKDGMEDFVLMSDDMESHRFNPDEEFSNFRGQLIVKVPSLTVVTFAKKYSVPTNFGILSIDAEGVGDVILHQWLDGGFRPAYILYEQLHNKEPISVTAEYMTSKGYKFLTTLGWNYIYEHQDLPDEGLNQQGFDS
ncbi:hypothetical protein BaRGS_00038476 [Batillaria attramentaria]|uniref:Methyltransferase FkbM domain-containing protein n=1 Tax=Batillaria attramentaria TaxID=370345 RepID=A0ABD0J6K3_9CAEN